MGCFVLGPVKFIFYPNSYPQKSIFECLIDSFETYIDTGFERN